MESSSSEVVDIALPQARGQDLDLRGEGMEEAGDPLGGGVNFRQAVSPGPEW